MSWEQAIQDAESLIKHHKLMIQKLRGAIVSFRDMQVSGMPWPEDKMSKPDSLDNPYDYRKGGCGISFNEFPEMRHTEDECPGPECSCYEVAGGHQMGCYFYGRSTGREV